MARLFTPSESKYYLMALDAGTGSIRAVIFDLEGNQIAVGQAEWRHLAVPDVPGSMEFDLNKNWQLACECMRQALHNAGIAPEYIAAVSACSMREGIVLYNNDGTPIWACANVDARAAREVSELKELHNNTFENKVYRSTGQTLALSAIPRLLWLAHHRSDIYRQASTITMISDWLAYMLSGELAVDPSNAGTTGLLDLTTRDWKPALLDMAGLRADILSPVKETGTLLGVVSSQAAELCGLKAGTPVVVGGGDVQLGCLGLGVVRPAQTAVLGGTFWQQVVNLAPPVTDPEMNVRVNPHVIPGMVQAESISFFTGLTMRWFRDAFCAEEKLIAERLGIDTYTLLEEMASRVPPGSWGVMPIFSDRMRFKTWYHAAPSFINLSIDPDKCNKATLFRALEENAAIVSACNLQQIADFSNIHPTSLVFAGGGSKGKLWSQILADVSGLPVNIPVVKEATALGCAIAAGVGAGIFSSMAETGERLVRWERTHTPDPEKHELYQDSRDKWQAVYQDQLGLVDILAGGNASLTTITTSVIGANEDSEGTVNVLGGTWRFYDSGNNARPLNVGQSGTGTLNIKQKGHVDGGYLRIGSSTGGVGTVNVEGEDSVLTTELFEIGSYGTGSLNITDKGYVTSSIVAILGYQAGSNGQVVVEKGGEWLIKNNDSSIEFQIGNQGTGEATIREGGLITAENTIIGGNATGIGTLNVQDQDSVITVRRLYNGYFGNGKVNISNNGLINNKEYSLVGVQDGSHGVVNVTDKGHWNFLGTGEAFRYIYIGDAGDGELHVSSEGKVDSGIITAGMKETGTGNITVKDKNSVITNLGSNLGYDGHGEMNISNEGLVVSNGGSSLGYGETGVGKVSITTGGIWEVNKNVYTTIGVAGVGKAKAFLSLIIPITVMPATRSIC